MNVLCFTDNALLTPGAPLVVVMPILSLVMGALVGSFLNVVIYRVPRGLDVNNPKRSYCPGCKSQIPWYRNIPVVTWLVQRGRCAGCDSKIPVRYVIVEILTSVLFWVAWGLYPDISVLIAWVLIALLVAISFIDGEHYVIPVNWCWLMVPVLMVVSFFIPGLLGLGDTSVVGSGWGGVLTSFSGFLIGYLGLVGVVLIGKLLFGKRVIECDELEAWSLKEPASDEEQLQFVLGEESIDWGEVFYRKTDRIELTGEQFLVDGQLVKGSSLVIRAKEVVIGERTFSLDKLKSLSGMASKVVIPREAMGAGDPPLLGMIGAFLGPFAVIFTLLSSCFYAIAAAILGRVGFGKPLPYGPFLALGALTWLFGGHRFLAWYLDFIGL